MAKNGPNGPTQIRTQGVPRTSAIAHKEENSAPREERKRRACWARTGSQVAECAWFGVTRGLTFWRSWSSSPMPHAGPCPIVSAHTALFIAVEPWGAGRASSRTTEPLLAFPDPLLGHGPGPGREAGNSPPSPNSPPFARASQTIFHAGPGLGQEQRRRRCRARCG